VWVDALRISRQKPPAIEPGKHFSWRTASEGGSYKGTAERQPQEKNEEKNHTVKKQG
jgi:hypothetical protein